MEGATASEVSDISWRFSNIHYYFRLSLTSLLFASSPFDRILKRFHGSLRCSFLTRAGTHSLSTSEYGEAERGSFKGEHRTEQTTEHRKPEGEAAEEAFSLTTSDNEDDEGRRCCRTDQTPSFYGLWD